MKIISVFGLGLMFLHSVFAFAADVRPGLSVPSSIGRLIERIQDGSVRPEVFRSTKRIARLPAPIHGEASTVTEIADQYIDEHLRIDPFWSPYYGEGDYSKLGNDLAQSTRDAYIAHYKNILSQLEKINPAKLSEFERDTYDLLQTEVTLQMREMQLPFHFLSISSWSGCRIVDHISSAAQWFPFQRLKHYEDFLKRSKATPEWVDTAIAVLQEGINRGITHDRYLAKLNLKLIEAADHSFEQSDFIYPIQHFPDGISSADQERLRRDFKDTYETIVYPAYSRFLHFYRDQYLPKTNDRAGLAAFGKLGKEMYAHRIELYSDQVMDIREVHQLGLQNVAMVANALEGIKTELGFTGPLVGFLKAMSADENSYFKTRADMLAAFENLRAEVNAKTSLFFNHVPNTDYVIKEVPEAQAFSAPSGSYYSPTETDPFGVFRLNTANLKSTPIFSVRSLSIHEAAPGHHFQLAIAFELRNTLGKYRSVSGTNAFIEGWAHYAEFLGQEMSLYPTTLDRLGYWSDQMLRAVRLVVDSGIHGYGWNHDQVVNYMSTYLPNDLSDIESEANRYAFWPGQALGYKVGQLQIIRLREKMKAKLGAAFDIRAFHDRVIGSGSLNLKVLDRKFE